LSAESGRKSALISRFVSAASETPLGRPQRRIAPRLGRCDMYPSYRGADHVAGEFPRIFELRNSLPDPLRKALRSQLSTKRLSIRRKGNFFGMSRPNFRALMQGLQRLSGPNSKKGVLQPLYDTLNERRINCRNSAAQTRLRQAFPGGRCDGSTTTLRRGWLRACLSSTTANCRSGDLNAAVQSDGSKHGANRILRVRRRNTADEDLNDVGWLALKRTGLSEAT
jgi:hypothetical protein